MGGVWAEPIEALKGCGPATGQRLRASGISTIGDLLRFFPRRHRAVRAIDGPSEEVLGEQVRVRGRIARVSRRFLPGKRVLVSARLETASDPIELSFFNQPWMKNVLEGATDRAFEGRLDREGKKFKLTAPRILSAAEDAGHECRVHYPPIDGLAESRIRHFVEVALEVADESTPRIPDLPETLGEGVDGGETYARGLEALRAMHRPESVEEHELARRGFALEEAVARFRAVAEWRAQREAARAHAIDPGEGFAERWAQALGFEPTGDQSNAIEALLERLAGVVPAGFLLQGDVGTGKTAVALCGLLATFDAGLQSAFLAPTELLVEQHHRELSRRLDPLGVSVVRLSSSMAAPERRAVEERLRSGEPLIVCGTHALFSQRTEFERLAFVVVDEQHRFGVEQRAQLFAKAAAPHVLVMTATPIPRTLTWTLFGDLDVLTLRDRPQGAAPPPALRLDRSTWPRVLDVIEAHQRRGGRVYVVCPAVGEDRQPGGAVLVGEELARRFPIEVVHGRLEPEIRRERLDRFRRGEVAVLCGTTVLEVGVDVPEATLMVIVRADRFGLATLHQLRGRVGRGRRRGLCLAVGDPSPRLRALCAVRDGFDLAEEDLRLRGAGELLGERQSGAFDFRSLDPLEDRPLLQRARDAVNEERARLSAAEVSR